MTLRKRIFYYFLPCTIFLVGSMQPVGAAHSYLNDVDSTASPSNSSELWPRIILAETKSFKDPTDRYAKYSTIAIQGGSLPKVAALQAKYPNIKIFRMFTPAEYLEYAHGGVHCSQGMGIPFENTGNITTPNTCTVYAGHWLYRAGTKSTRSINTTSKTINVQDTRNFSPGQYAVIYDGAPGAFNNAEHVKIVGKSGSSLTVQRGYKSTAKSHSNNAIVAQHVLGQGTGPLDWSYNLSSKCPKDGAGHTVAQVMAGWLKQNYTKDYKGNNTNAKVSGILFDVDIFFKLTSKKADVDNDLKADDGISSSGVNMWGQGIDTFHGLVRNQLPNFVIVGGTKNSRGFKSLNGTQIEGFPDLFGSNADLSKLDEQIASYLTATKRFKKGPSHTHVLNKRGSRLYPGRGRPSNNAPFRLAFGLTLLGDGFYGEENSPENPDKWHEEYAVDVKKGSPTFGRAIGKDDVAGVRKHLGWLGRPLGAKKRIYDDADFAPSQSIVPNGTFDSGISGWSGKNVSVAGDSGNRLEGAAALRASNHKSYSPLFASTQIQGPKVRLTRGVEYTLAFSAKAGSDREIGAAVGSATSQRFMVFKDWTRKVVTFKAPSTGDFRINFSVGRENTPVWIDSVYLFPKNANVFRRDFNNGIVVVNATGSAKQVNLGGTFQRILGTQDSVNNGASLSSVSIPAYDSAILVGQGSGSGGGSTGGGDTGGGGSSSGTECGEPSYNTLTDKALFLWKDCGTGKWNVRTTSGNSSSGLAFKGTVVAKSSISALQKISVESSDKVAMSGGSQITYDLKVIRGGFDGYGFKVGNNANACFKLNGNFDVRLGKSRKKVARSIDLKTLGACQ